MKIIKSKKGGSRLFYNGFMYTLSTGGVPKLCAYGAASGTCDLVSFRCRSKANLWDAH